MKPLGQATIELHADTREVIEALDEVERRVDILIAKFKRLHGLRAVPIQGDDE